jgi:hypothetical protein
LDANQLAGPLRLALFPNEKRARYKYATLTYGSQGRNQPIEAIGCRIDGFRHRSHSAIYLSITVVNDYFGERSIPWLNFALSDFSKAWSEPNSNEAFGGISKVYSSSSYE